MPSNYRPKSTLITLKVPNRRAPARPPTPDLSGDEGYSALEELSDTDDDDEENVNAAEEEHLKNITHNHRRAGSPRPVPAEEDDDEDEEEEAEQDADEDGDDEEDADEEDIEEDDDDDDAHDGDYVEDGDDKSWNGISSESDGTGAKNAPFSAIHRHVAQAERHVRFANVPDSDSDSTDTDEDHDDMFPDIFVEQSSLDPAIRRAIDRDPDDSSGSGSFWDLNGGFDYSSAESDVDPFLPRATDDDVTPLATPVASDVQYFLSQFSDLPSEVPTPTRALDSSADLDGYETDGDTTEEDIPEPIVRKKTRRPDPVDDGESDSDCAPVKSNRGKPRVGRFNLDKSDKKPIAVLNPITRKMMIFTPHKHRHLDLSPEQFNFTFFTQAETTSQDASTGSTYMLDAMFSTNTFGDFMNSHGSTLGDVDAMLQSALMSEANTADESLESDMGYFDLDVSPHRHGHHLLAPDAGEKALDIDDFITFAASGLSESEYDMDTDVASTPAVPTSTPAAAGNDGDDAEVLTHLTSATVGAFRQNQITQQLILSNRASEDSLAFSGRFNDTALKGLRSDRLATGALPLTPARRRKRSGSAAQLQQPGSMEPPTSPLESIALKRKADGVLEGGHKRQRSISDMALLHV